MSIENITCGINIKGPSAEKLTIKKYIGAKRQRRKRKTLIILVLLRMT